MKVRDPGSSPGWTIFSVHITFLNLTTHHFFKGYEYIIWIFTVKFFIISLVVSSKNLRALAFKKDNFENNPVLS